MIHPPSPFDPGYRITSKTVCLPGRYETEAAARYAFFFQDHVLKGLEDSINIGQQREITTADLEKIRPRWRKALK